MAYDSEDLLSELRATLQLVTNTSGATDAQLYRLLQNAQVRVARLLATHAPHANRVVGQLQTTDGGYTYEFDYAPLGHAELRDGRGGALLLPTSDWNPNGYVMEGKVVRMPNGQPRLFGNGLYARYTRTPGDLNAVAQPILQPEDVRLGIVYDAAVEFAGQGGAMDKTPYEHMKRDFFFGNPEMPGDIGVIAALKTQYYGQGAAAQAPDRWWTGQNWR